MTQRELVYAAIAFEHPVPTPYDVGLTLAMRERLIAYAGEGAFDFERNKATAGFDLNAPQVSIGNDRDRDEYGVIWNKSKDKDIGVIEGTLIEDEDDLNRFAMPSIDEARIRAGLAALEKKTDKFRVASLGFSLFERAWTLHGMEALLVDMLVEPDFVHALMSKIVERNLKLVDLALEYDIDAVYFGDDWGQQQGLIMGPKCWREFIKPYLAQMYGKVRGAGKYVVQHSCGDIREIMDDVIDLGLNVYQTFQPEIYGLDYAKKLKGRLTIWGGISTQRDLPVRTPDEIRTITRKLLAAFPEGGLIAAPTHGVPGDVPPENLLAMLDVLQNQ